MSNEPVREMTLKEYVEQLSETHPARVEYEKLLEGELGPADPSPKMSHHVWGINDE